jgi:hypothetical protein
MSTAAPVALFIFNRPMQTARVFSQIAHMRPRQLFVVADGPRGPEEIAACAAAREVCECVDWPCDVHRHYSETNVGCRRRMSSGIDWVFSQVERAILLEDDCLPDPTFFPFCEELLERYAEDERVMMISGDNFQFGDRPAAESYYFSAIPHIWGWATWRRAWAHYDVNMRSWPAEADGNFHGNLLPPQAARYHQRLIADVYAGKIDTWDVQWSLACWLRRGLTILPSVNLISNIGFGPGATHTRKADPFASLPTEPMQFPLRHPDRMTLNAEADRAFFRRALKAA